jgi:hypothetical protein
VHNGEDKKRFLLFFGEQKISCVVVLLVKTTFEPVNTLLLSFSPKKITGILYKIHVYKVVLLQKVNTHKNMDKYCIRRTDNRHAFFTVVKICTEAPH